MKPFFRAACSLWFFSIVLSLNTKAQQSNVPVAKDVYATLPQTKKWLWTQDVWIGSSKPYGIIRKSIELSIAKGKSPTLMAEQYAVDAKKQKDDPLLQFRWAYASYQAYRGIKLKMQGVAPLKESEMLYRVEQTLAQMPSPHVAEWTRLRFLIEAELFPDASLKAVGKRLIELDPTDRAVVLRYVDILTKNANGTEDDEELISLCQKLLKQKPDDPNSYARLGGAYLSIWQRTKSSSSAEQAIRNYQKYLQMAPANAPFRKRAQFWIDHIKSKK